MQMYFAARNAFTIIENVICNDKILIQLNISLLFVIKIDVSNLIEKLFSIKQISIK